MCGICTNINADWYNLKVRTFSWNCTENILDMGRQTNGSYTKLSDSYSLKMIIIMAYTLQSLSIEITSPTRSGFCCIFKLNPCARLLPLSPRAPARRKPPF